MINYSVIYILNVFLHSKSFLLKWIIIKIALRSSSMLWKKSTTEQLCCFSLPIDFGDPKGQSAPCIGVECLDYCNNNYSFLMMKKKINEIMNQKINLIKQKLVKNDESKIP